MKNSLLGLLTVALFGVAGYLAFRGFSGPKGIVEKVESPGVCLACKQEVLASYKVGEAPPLVCSACGERAVFQWFYCYDCHRRFVPEPEPAPDGGFGVPMYPKCYACGCQSVQQLIPNFQEHVPSGDANLPKWPPKKS